MEVALARRNRSLARQLCHWGPGVALTLISIVIVSATYAAIQLNGLPTVTYFKRLNLAVIYPESLWVLYMYYHACRGPGFVPLRWKPVRFNYYNL